MLQSQVKPQELVEPGGDHSEVDLLGAGLVVGFQRWSSLESRMARQSEEREVDHTMIKDKYTESYEDQIKY